MSDQGITAAPAAPAAIPSIEEVANQFFPSEAKPPSAEAKPGEQAPPSEEAKPEDDSTKKWERLSNQERELYRQKKQLADERLAFKKEQDEKNGQRLEIDSIVNDILKNDEDGGEEDPSKLDPDELEKRIRDKIFQEIEERDNKSKEENETNEQVNSFKTEITDFVKERSKDFPLVEGMGGSDIVFSIIEQQYQKDANEFGHERAGEQMMTIEKASELANQHLASEIKKVLQYEGMREYLKKELGQVLNDDPSSVPNESRTGQESKSPSTLNNNDFAPSTPSADFDESKITDAERFNRALSLIK